jgi:hypothetical protein
MLERAAGLHKLAAGSPRALGKLDFLFLDCLKRGLGVRSCISVLAIINKKALATHIAKAFDFQRWLRGPAITDRVQH